MEILIKAFIAFGLAFLIIAFLHWLINKNNEKQEVYHAGGQGSPPPETEEYEYQGDKTIVRRKK